MASRFEIEFEGQDSGRTQANHDRIARDLIASNQRARAAMRGGDYGTGAAKAELARLNQELARASKQSVQNTLYGPGRVPQQFLPGRGGFVGDGGAFPADPRGTSTKKEFDEANRQQRQASKERSAASAENAAAMRRDTAVINQETANTKAARTEADEAAKTAGRAARNRLDEESAYTKVIERARAKEDLASQKREQFISDPKSAAGEEFQLREAQAIAAREAADLITSDAGRQVIEDEAVSRAKQNYADALVRRRELIEDRELGTPQQLGRGDAQARLNDALRRQTDLAQTSVNRQAAFANGEADARQNYNNALREQARSLQTDLTRGAAQIQGRVDAEDNYNEALRENARVQDREQNRRTARLQGVADAEDAHTAALRKQTALQDTALNESTARLAGISDAEDSRLASLQRETELADTEQNEATARREGRNQAETQRLAAEQESARLSALEANSKQIRTQAQNAITTQKIAAEQTGIELDILLNTEDGKAIVAQQATNAVQQQILAVRLQNLQLEDAGQDVLASLVAQEQILRAKYNEELAEKIKLEGVAQGLTKLQIQQALANAGVGGPGGTRGGGGPGGGPLGGFPGGRGITSLFRFAVPIALGFTAFRGLGNFVKEAEEVEVIFNRIGAQFANLEQLEGRAFNTDSLKEFKGEILDIARTTGSEVDAVATTASAFLGAFAEQGPVAAAAATRVATEIAILTGIAPDEIFNDLVAASRSFAEEAGGSVLQALVDIGDEIILVRNITGVAGSELVDVIGKIGPVAQAAGADMRELSAVTAALLQQSGTSGGAIAEQLGRIISGFPELTGELLDLGQQVPELALDREDIITGDVFAVLEQLIRGYEQLAPAQQQFIQELVGGRREGATFTALLQNSSTALQVLDSNFDASGARAAEFERRQETLSFQMSQVGAAFEELGIKLFDAGLSDLLIGAANAAEAFATILNSTLIPALNIMGDILGLVTGLLDKLAGTEGFAAAGATFAGALVPVAGILAARRAGLAAGGLGAAGGAFRGRVADAGGVFSRGGAGVIAGSTGRALATTAFGPVGIGLGLLAVNALASGTKDAMERDAREEAERAFGRAGEQLALIGIETFFDAAASENVRAQRIARTARGDALQAPSGFENLIDFGDDPIGGLADIALDFGDIVLGVGPGANRTSDRSEARFRAAADAFLSSEMNAFVAGVLSGEEEALDDFAELAFSSEELRAIGDIDTDVFGDDALIVTLRDATDPTGQSVTTFDVDEYNDLLALYQSGQELEVEEIQALVQVQANAIFTMRQAAGDSVEEIANFLSNQGFGLDAITTATGGVAPTTGEAFGQVLEQDTDKVLQQFELGRASFGDVSDKLSEELDFQRERLTETETLFSTGEATPEILQAAFEDLNQAYDQTVGFFEEGMDRLISALENGSITGETFDAEIAELTSDVERELNKAREAGDDEQANKLQALLDVLAELDDSVLFGLKKRLADLKIRLELGIGDQSANEAELNAILAEAERAKAIAIENEEFERALSIQQLIDDSLNAAEDSDISGRRRRTDGVLARLEQTRAKRKLSGTDDIATQLSDTRAARDELISVGGDPEEIQNLVDETFELIQALVEFNADNTEEAADALAILEAGLPTTEADRLAALYAAVTNVESAFSLFLEDQVFTATTLTNEIRATIGDLILAGVDTLTAIQLAIISDQVALAVELDSLRTEFDEAPGGIGGITEKVGIAAQIAVVENQIQNNLDTLGKVREDADAIRAAAERASAPIEVTGSADSQRTARQAAARDAASAAEEAADLSAELTDAQLDILEAQLSGDPVAVARIAQQRAANQVAQATNAAEEMRGIANQIRADRQLEEALRDVSSAQIELLQAFADVAGDSVLAADLSLQEAQTALANAEADYANGQIGDAALARAQAEVVRSEGGLRDAQLADQLDNIDFLREMGDITTAQAIKQLETILAGAEQLGLNEDQKRDLERRIKGLRDELGSDLQFNLPDLLLPTFYEARRLSQGGFPGPQGSQSNVVQNTVNINVHEGADQSAVYDAVGQAIGGYPGNTFGSSTFRP